MNNEKKKVVIYVRTKTNNSGSLSVEEQLAKCRQYCKDNNFIVVGEYIDVTNNVNIEDRQNFMKMINDSNNKEFEGVIVYRLDRFSRSRYDNAIYKSKLKKNGVKVYSTMEGFSDDASGIIAESFFEGIIEYCSKSEDLFNKILEKREANLNNEQ